MTGDQGNSNTFYQIIRETRGSEPNNAMLDAKTRVRLDSGFIGNSFGLAVAIADRSARYGFSKKVVNKRIVATGALLEKHQGEVEAIDHFLDKIAVVQHFRSIIPKGSLFIFPLKNLATDDTRVAGALKQLEESGIEYRAVAHINELNDLFPGLSGEVDVDEKTAAESPEEPNQVPPDSISSRPAEDASDARTGALRAAVDALNATEPRSVQNLADARMAMTSFDESREDVTGLKQLISSGDNARSRIEESNRRIADFDRLLSSWTVNEADGQRATEAMASYRNLEAFDLSRMEEDHGDDVKTAQRLEQLIVESDQRVSRVPLRESSTTKSLSPADDILEAEEFVGHVTAAVKWSDRDIVDQFGWEDMDLTPHRAGMESWGYRSADVFTRWSPDELGINLVIAQQLDELSQEIWHVHPDLVIALGLVQEGDRWFRPAEGWAEVIRLKRGDDGKPNLVEIKSEFLMDYLVARDMSLFCSSYSERIVVTATDPGYNWPNEKYEEERGRDKLEAFTRPQEYGYPEGAFFTLGAIWRTEWVEPGKVSIRIRGDEDPHESTFALDHQGHRVPVSKLHRSMTWLYFKPELALALQRYRGGRLHWHSQETGALGATRSTLHFGVNGLGLITVFAKDVGDLHGWERRVWSAHNATPEGGVCDELFSAQMQCVPADTTAPETEIAPSLDRLSAVFEDRYGSKLLRDHDTVEALLRRAHRFQAAEEAGLLALSKDLTRLFLERVNVDEVLSQISNKAPKEKLGSLKSLERLLAEIVAPDEARTIMGPLSGIYDLRSADAHLGTSKIESAMMRAGIDDQEPEAIQGRRLIQSFVDSINRISDTIAKPHAASADH